MFRLRPPRAVLVVVALLALGALVRALRFAGRFAGLAWAHWDESKLAIQALQALGGDFPVHHMTIEYLGASPSYPLAIWFTLAGGSSVALDIFAWAAGVACLWTGWLLARRVLEPIPALFALAVLAVPPVELSHWSLSGNMNWIFLVLLGNLVLLATHTLFFRRPGCPRALLVLGLLTGLGWWTNPLVVVYLVPFGLLAVRTGLLWRPRIWLFVGGLALGGLPAWVYEAQYFPSSRFVLHQAGYVEAEPLGERIRLLTGRLIPDVLGVRLARLTPSLEGVLELAVLLLAVAAVVGAAIRDRGALRWAAGARRSAPPAAAGRLLLWGVLLANLALAAVSSRPLEGRYLLPLYSVLPYWIGDTLHGLWSARRAVGAAALATLLGLHAWSNTGDTVARTTPSQWRWASVKGRMAPVVRWLDERGIRRVYFADVPHLQSYEFTYLTGMRIVAADLWREGALPHAHAVDAAAAPPIVTRTLRKELHSGLRALGIDVRETPVGAIYVLEPVPTFATGFVPIGPEGWVVRASGNASEAANLIDRDASTGWRSPGPQAPGQWVAVDLGREETVTRVDLLAIDWQEVPSGYRVEVSRDGKRWQPVVVVPQYWGPLFFSEHHAFLKVRQGRVQAIFPPVRTRLVRLVQTGEVPYRDWAARELFVYGPGGPRPPLPREGEITAALREEGVQFVYADHWLSAWVQAESHGRIAGEQSNAATNSYGHSPDPRELGRFRARRDYAILLGADADAPGVRAMLAGQGIAVRERAAGAYRLLLLTPGPVPRRLPRDGWRATASENTAEAWHAIDGADETRWQAGATPASQLTVDLGQVRRVGGLAGRPGPAAGGARGLRVEGSVDGRDWRALQPLAWAGPLYWSGSELLRNGEESWAVAFPPTSLRYLRLSSDGPAAASAWSLAELDAFE